MLERYVYKNQKKMRCGYTTGTCACAAAKAAAYMLLSGREVKEIKVITPMGVSLTLPVIDIDIKKDKVICAIKKDSGDDPDVTDGIMIYAQVAYAKDDIMSTINTDRVIVDGGIGVGRVTREGLKCAVGEAAINPVPLKMIKEAVAEAAESYSYEGSLKVIISAPKGVDIAKKTFNPNLGITGGISILGTTGIVEPMSEQALIDTIKTEINMHKAQGEKVFLVAPGNYGQDFLLNTLNIELKRSIKCSNYIGDTIDMVCDSGAKAMLLVGHIGKLVKLGAGIMNTHSKVADGRMEVMSACAIRAGADADTAGKILDCITTEAALEILKKSDILEKTMYQLTLRIEDVLQRRSSGKIVIGAIVFSNEYGILGKTPAADKLLELIKSS
jgi:cobalt-precorrin-5B (C1)-methyltransferase